MILKTLAIILLAGLTVTSIGRAAPPAAGDEKTLPSKTQLKRAVSAALQAEARQRRQRKLSEDGVANESYARSVVQLCDRFAEIRGDQRYGDSEMLQKLVITLRHRLLDVAHTLEHQLQRDEVPRPAWLASTSAAIRRSSNPASPLDSTSQPSASQPSAEPHGNAAGGGLIDNGWQLVELIQQTIQPGFWDTTGGPGSIYYFALKRALVIRATSEVHADLGNTLQQLKRN
ncbi:hypothetical protein [Roseimaritima ulvae]|uniref:Secreted protein n=1 Tax=Roseimaritima ulvae TaxID=980254 RepID=A0A5B9QVQ6_9BACT|nr:hypothetical protein [Roseimaritima ulvae]QEG41979.1 hypothetical protein UC8_40080 [Roseimaritima ulvae]